ncbi:hypothetical protein O0L34_g13292 [Tuta absoluta]|nr:hypothetical protein O0L34_g13292 [Tuta absoluta]
MHWYDGTIAEAVALSKQRNAIFVVFIEDEHELSAEMAATIDDSNVLKRLADQKNFLAIKLMSGSPNYTHFAQIYQFVPVPSLFFIGRNGTPLEVVCAGVEPSNLATRIDRILEEHHKPTAQPSSSAQNLKQQTADLLTAEASVPETSKPSQECKSLDHAKPESSSEPPKKQQKTEHVEITKSGKEYDVVCDGDVCTRVLRVGPSDPGPSSANVIIKDAPKSGEESTPVPAETKPVVPCVDDKVEKAKELIEARRREKLAKEKEASKLVTPNVDDKVEKAKELIEARRREKLAKEKELEIQKELERRAQGQGATELKKWQQEQELKNIQEERKREKMENNLVRQKILEQIAQDRAERKARDQPQVEPQSSPSCQNILDQLAQVRNERKARDQTQVVQPVLVQQPTVPAPPPTAGDGGNHCRIQFKLPDGSSHTAHFDASGTLGDVQTYVADNLQMTTSNFSLWTAFPRQELTEYEATLRQLKLTPSSALLVLPRRVPTTVATPSALTNIITLFTQFFTAFILEPSQQLYTWLVSRLSSDTPNNTRPPTNSPAGPPGPPNTRVTPPSVRRRGNVHRLGEERSPDDDNNTWNGNSTQQM